MIKGDYTIVNLLEESKEALLSPKTFFTTIKTGGKWGKPIYKAFIYGFIAGMFILLWSLLDVIGITEGVLSGNIGVIGFFSTILGAVIGLFVGGFIILIISAICNGAINFSLSLEIAAAIMVVLPLNAFLGFLDGISYLTGTIISLGVYLYGLYLLYIALTLTLKGDNKPARIISYILGILMILSLVAILLARNAVMKYNRNQEIQSMDYSRGSDINEVHLWQGIELLEFPLPTWEGPTQKMVSSVLEPPRKVY